MTKKNQSKDATGLSYLAQGFRLIFYPGLKRFVFIPLLINLILYAATAYWFYHLMQGSIHAINHILPTWLHWLDWLLWPLMVLTALITLASTFSITANIIASPFNTIIAQKVEALQRGEQEKTASSWQDLIQTAPLAIKRQLAIILYALPRALALLLLFFIPLINVAAPLLWALFSAWMISLQYLDYPFDNHHISFASMRQSIHQRKASTLGFGATILCCNMVPLLNLFTISAAAAAASLFWLDHFSQDPP
jgi:CysZ protein